MKKLVLCGVLSLSMATLVGSSAVRAQEGEQRVALDAFDGKLRTEKGAKYKLRSFARTYQTSQFPSFASRDRKSISKMASTTIKKLNSDYEVISVDSFGNHQARITYGIATSATTVTVDGKPYSQRGYGEISKVQNEHLKKIKSVSFVIKISPEGKVIGIMGLDAARQKIYSQYWKKSPYDGDRVKQTLQPLLSDEAVSERFSHQIGPLPAYPMRVSELWDYTIDRAPDSIYGPPLKGQRTLVSLADGIASLKSVATFEYDSRKEEGKPRGMEGVYLKLTGTENTITRSTAKTGMPVEIVNTQTMNGNVHSRFDPTAKKGKIHAFPLSVTTTSRLVIEKQ